MKRRHVGAAAVLALAGAVIVWREAHREPARQAVPANGVRVVLYADLGEADEAEGCGAIIRGVRQTAKRGSPTLEVDARSPSEHLARYRLLVAPTVLLLDTSGRETARFEGEGPETVRAILKRLASQ